MARVYNFSAGPAVLPEEVLSSAAAEMLDYQGTGMSVMEMSHRSAAFKGIIETAEQDIRDLMNIPDNYRVLFLQGGATLQFAGIPMNLMQNKVADYIVSGSWSKKAWKEAKIFGEARCVASSEDENFCYVPDVAGLEFDPEADYVYICQNETIYGNHATPSCPNRRHPAGLRRVEHVPLRAHGRVEVRPDLRRRAEERRPGRRDHRHRARRLGARGRAALHAHHHALQDAGRRRQPVQHPPCYGIYMCGKGVPVAQGPGRP